MEGYQTDIQALLQDISGNYEDPEPEQPPQPPLPYSRPISKSYNFKTDHSFVPRNALAPSYNQQPLYEAQASRPSDAYSYSPYNYTGLDAYGSCSNLVVNGRLAPANCCPDRAFLAEPQPRSQWRANSTMRTVPAEILSSPGHTAPHSPVNAFQQPKAQQQRRGWSRRVLPMFYC